MTQGTTYRAFEAGTTGWTVDALSDPEIQWHWSQGRYELVEGVLTKMAPQGIQGVRPLDRLRRLIERHLDATGQGGEFYTEADLLLRPSRVPRPDLVFLTPGQLAAQELCENERDLSDDDYRPLYVMPHLVVESVSAGHEIHDRVTKREWYLDAKVPHYWLLTAGDRSLKCLSVQNDAYVEIAAGHNDDVIPVTAFDGLAIPLAELWRKQ
jgi:Uma2 family endonuclease